MQIIQRVLPIDLCNHSYDEDDFFVSECNAEAHRMICQIEPSLWPHNRVMIVAEPGSGKSHLARIWIDKKPNRFLIDRDDLSEIERGGFMTFTEKAVASDGFVIDIGSHLASRSQERILFSMINLSLEHQIPLLLLCSGVLAVSLPDLRSRIAATYVIRIGAPSIEMIQVLVHKYLSDMQINLKKRIIDYIVMKSTNQGFSVVRDIIMDLKNEIDILNRDISVKNLQDIGAIASS